MDPEFPTLRSLQDKHRKRLRPWPARKVLTIHRRRGREDAIPLYATPPGSMLGAYQRLVAMCTFVERGQQQSKDSWPPCARLRLGHARHRLWRNVLDHLKTKQ